MSSITLESLRSDYETVYLRLNRVHPSLMLNPIEWLKSVLLRKRYQPKPITIPVPADALLDLGSIIVAAQKSTVDSWVRDAILTLHDKAMILDIAERFGLKAAMLYKLSDGAIDPRKP